MSSIYRHAYVSCIAAGLMALAPVLAARADDTVAVPTIAFSGRVVSATGTLPEKLGVFAECQNERPRIMGTVNDDGYHLDLPPGVVCTITLGEQDWAADSQPVFDAGTAVPQTMLIYPREVPEPELALELIEMGKQDNALRHAWPKGKPDAAFLKRAEAEERARQLRLRQIITTKGWPTISMVGAEAANSAWLVAQHARPAQLKHWLIFMRAAATRHEINPANLATSIDRVRVNLKQQQLYGTQYRAGADGAIEMYPIEDIANLDARRFSMGMSSHAAYIEALKR